MARLQLIVVALAALFVAVATSSADAIRIRNSSSRVSFDNSKRTAANFFQGPWGVNTPDWMWSHNGPRLPPRANKTRHELGQPTSFLTPFRTVSFDQSSCDACYSFAIMAIGEADMCDSASQRYPNCFYNGYALSPQQLISCWARSCTAQDPVAATTWLVNRRTFKDDTWEYTSYGGAVGSCRTSGADGWTPRGIWRLTGTQLNFNTVSNYVYGWQVVTVGIHICPDFKTYRSASYPYTTYRCRCSASQYLGKHLMIVVGYNTTSAAGSYLIVKNSWGDSWGRRVGNDGGYVYLQSGTCGMFTTANMFLYGY